MKWRFWLWMGSSYHSKLDPINRSEGTLRDQGRSTVRQEWLPTWILDGLAQTRFGGFFYA
jgi:hypothetical protein